MTNHIVKTNFRVSHTPDFYWASQFISESKFWLHDGAWCCDWKAWFTMLLHTGSQA